MSDVKGNLEVKLTLNRGERPDLAQAASVFGQAAERMGIGCNSGNVDSVGTTVRIRTEVVSGITDAPATVSASFLPGSARTAGMVRIMVAQHPDGSDAAAKLARGLAERAAEAFGMQLRLDDGRFKSKRGEGHVAVIPANGWNGQFQSVFADFTPDWR
jgi:hypothetical protein